MSEVSQGPGWWLASDGRWYPPDQVPGYPEPGGGSGQGFVDTPPTDVGPNASAPAEGFESSAGTSPPGTPGSAPPVVPGYPPPGYGPTGDPPGYPPPNPGFPPPTGPPGYAPPLDPGYGYPPGGPLYGYVPVQKTNGMAIASLVCSLVWLGGVGSILAVIFGFIARSQIKKSEGTVQGNGLAIAGIIIGAVGVIAVVGFVIFVAALVHHCDQTGNCTSNTYNFGN